MKWRKPYGKERRWNRAALIKRDGLVCGLCQEPIVHMRDVTIDHVTPVSKGGTDRLDNLRLAHEGCNSERGNGFFDTSRPRPTAYGHCPTASGAGAHDDEAVHAAGADAEAAGVPKA